MGKIIDLTGRTDFGKWAVLRRDEMTIGGSVPKWICRCECGAEQSVNGQMLRAGESTRCRRCKDAEQVLPASSVKLRRKNAAAAARELRRKYIADERKKGRTLAEIADEMGVTKQAIHATKPPRQA